MLSPRLFWMTNCPASTCPHKTNRVFMLAAVLCTPDTVQPFDFYPLSGGSRLVLSPYPCSHLVLSPRRNTWALQSSVSPNRIKLPTWPSWAQIICLCWLVPPTPYFAPNFESISSTTYTALSTRFFLAYLRLCQSYQVSGSLDEAALV